MKNFVVSLLVMVVLMSCNEKKNVVKDTEVETNQMEIIDTGSSISDSITTDHESTHSRD